MKPIQYRDYTIRHDPPPIPARMKCDWQFSHKDYDGAPDGEDERCGYAESLDACMKEIDLQIESFEYYQEYLERKK